MSAPNHSKQCACYENQLQNPRGTWLQLHSCRSLHKHARANLARGRSFSSVGARSGLGLTGARERSKSLKIVRLPRNLAPGRTGFLVCGRGGGSAPAQHCIHARESGSALAQAHQRCIHACGGGGGWGGWGRDGKHTRSSAPARHCIHAKEEAHLLKRTRSALHPRMPGGGGWGGGWQAHPLSAPTRHCIHTRERGSAPASTHAGGGGVGGGW